MTHVKSRDEELETETEILRDRDETWDLRDQDFKKRVSRRVSRPSLETPSLLRSESCENNPHCNRTNRRSRVKI